MPRAGPDRCPPPRARGHAPGHPRRGGPASRLRGARTGPASSIAILQGAPTACEAVTGSRRADGRLASKGREPRPIGLARGGGDRRARSTPRHGGIRSPPIPAARPVTDSGGSPPAPSLRMSSATRDNRRVRAARHGIGIALVLFVAAALYLSVRDVALP